MMTEIEIMPGMKLMIDDTHYSTLDKSQITTFARDYIVRVDLVLTDIITKHNTKVEGICRLESK